MSNNKNKKTYRITQRSATRTTSTLKRSLKRINWRLSLTVLGLTILFTVVYQVAMGLELGFVMWVYYIALILLAVCYLIANRGISRTPPPREALPTEWSEEQKDEYLDTLTKRKKRARIFLVFIIPLLFSFMYEVIYLFYLEPFLSGTGIFGA